MSNLPIGIQSAIGNTPEPGTTGTSADAPERTPLECNFCGEPDGVCVCGLKPLDAYVLRVEALRKKVAALEQERDGAHSIAWALHPDYEEGKDPPWPSNLHLVDVIEKHLGRCLWAEVERLRAADNTPTPEKLEAWGEWFDDPQNPFIGFDTTKLAHHISTAGYVCRVFAAQLRAIAKPEGEEDV